VCVFVAGDLQNQPGRREITAKKKIIHIFIRVHVFSPFTFQLYGILLLLYTSKYSFVRFQKRARADLRLKHDNNSSCPVQLPSPSLMVQIIEDLNRVMRRNYTGMARLRKTLEDEQKNIEGSPQPHWTQKGGGGCGATCM
jgi:hypothetical protein